MATCWRVRGRDMTTCWVAERKNTPRAMQRGAGARQSLKAPVSVGRRFKYAGGGLAAWRLAAAVLKPGGVRRGGRGGRGSVSCGPSRLAA